MQEPFSGPCSEIYADANDLIKKFRFEDGQLFIDAIDNIEYADPW